PIRLCITTGLLSGQHNVSEMVECTGIAQPTISQHINVLKAAGIIEGVREGNQILYSVVSRQAEKIVKSLE
ncbi:MAG: ArsR/SmtB family transcription factor, partial [Chitinispirillaceae bacterium]